MRSRTGSANLPLHGGKAPAGLFSRMIRLSREITTHMGLDRSERVAAPKRLVRFGGERVRTRLEREPVE
jgi:hypothetical protein